MKPYDLKYYRNVAAAGVKVVAALLLALFVAGCAGGSLFNPTPMTGRDRLVFRVMDQMENTTYYTRNVWYDGDNYRFHDVYGRDISIARDDSVVVDIISAAAYYKTP